jgi:hypothetical protein
MPSLWASSTASAHHGHHCLLSQNIGCRTLVTVSILLLFVVVAVSKGVELQQTVQKLKEMFLVDHRSLSKQDSDRRLPHFRRWWLNSSC